MDVPNAPSVDPAVPSEEPAIEDTILVAAVIFLILLFTVSQTYKLPKESMTIPVGVLKVATGMVAKGDDREARPSVEPVAVLLPATAVITSAAAYSVE